MVSCLGLYSALLGSSFSKKEGDIHVFFCVCIVGKLSRPVQHKMFPVFDKDKKKKKFLGRNGWEEHAFSYSSNWGPIREQGSYLCMWERKEEKVGNKLHAVAVVLMVILGNQRRCAVQD